MNKKPVKVMLDQDTHTALETTGARFGLTPNTILAIVGYEISRVSPEDFWHAIGRITGGVVTQEALEPRRVQPRQRPIKPAPVQIAD